jgi:hypothetical protein
MLLREPHSNLARRAVPIGWQDCANVAFGLLHFRLAAWFARAWSAEFASV